MAPPIAIMTSDIAIMTLPALVVNSTDMYFGLRAKSICQNRARYKDRMPF